MSSILEDHRLQTAGMVAIAVATGAAFWAGEGLRAAIVPFAALLALALVIAVGRTRSDTIQTLSGIGDERTRTNAQRATAFAGNVTATAVPAWWLITVAQGEANDTLSGVAAIFGIAFILGTAYYARRS